MSNDPQNAWEELQDKLLEGEYLVAIVFGKPGDGMRGEEKTYVPENRRYVVLSPKEARRYMKNWCFDGGYGGPECYAAFIWTNKRVFWVSEYDGRTELDAAPRNPENVKPRMS